jgi:hypothetical protein
MNTGRSRHHHGDVAVVMMVLREHRKDALLDEERLFTVAQLLRDRRQRQADLPDAL